jgi:peptidoglycan hydrolase CwlO-like protein
MKESLSVKSTQDWLRELSEASEKLMAAFQREKSARMEAERRWAQVEAEQAQVEELKAQVAGLEASLLEAMQEAEQARREASEAQKALVAAQQEATLREDEQRDSDRQSTYNSQSNQDQETIRMTPDFIDGLVNEIDACLMKLKQ